jgi:hypothetical protein
MVETYCTKNPFKQDLNILYMVGVIVKLAMKIKITHQIIKIMLTKT